MIKKLGAGLIASLLATSVLAASPTVIVDTSGNPVGVTAGALNTTASISGSVTVNSKAHATAANPTYTEGTDDPLSVNLSGQLRTLAAQTGTWTVNLGTLNGVALDASVLALQVGQGSTTAGQNGTLVQCAVTTSSPSYTTAQTSPCSLDTSGNLRVNVVTGGGAGGSTKVTVNSPPNDVIAGPTGYTSPNTLAVNSQGAGAVGIQATGTGAGLTFSFQATANGTTWFSIPCGDVAGNVVTSASANGQWVCPVSGWPQTRVNLTAISSGTETFTLNSSAGSASLPLGIQGTATNLTGINGTAISNTNALPSNQIPSTPVLEAALSTTVQTVNGSLSTLTGYYCYNPNSSVAYVQIFDISGTVTLGTSTPKWSIGIPATSAANLSVINQTYANAIKVAATTTATGLTAPSTALDCNFSYR